MDVSPYIRFTHQEWGQLRDGMPLPLSEEDLAYLRGLNEQVSLDEVKEIYLPLSRLLNLYVAATQSLHQATSTFLSSQEAKVPYIIGMAGSVAAGKSTTARILQALLSRWPNHPQVDLVTTDGFLYPNAELEKRGLMKRKGFPESYDVRNLLQFVSDIKAGKFPVVSPVYSHLTYDIVPEEKITVDRSDIVIVEGLNVLQPPRTRHGRSHLAVSDFFDFTVYVDAEIADLRRWYVERFLTLRNTAFQDSRSFFHRYSQLSDRAAVAEAERIWKTINGINLRRNILPTRERAHLILEKGPDHSVESVRLRKI